MKIFALLICALFAQSALADNTYVICGKTVDIDSFTIQGFELALSSEGSDAYKGPVGKSWNLKLGSEDSDWLAPNKNVIAKTSKTDGKTAVEIIIKNAQTPSGPVGTRYVLSDLYDDEPVLEKYTFGGFAGKVKAGEFRCLTGND